MITYHIISFSIGFLLDTIIGDPYFLPHPIRLIGNLIGFLDKFFMDEMVATGKRDKRKEMARGALCVAIVLFLTVVVTGVIVMAAYKINPCVGIAVESILTGYCLAAKSLKTESMKVYKELKAGDLKKARFAVSMIVGRDTEALDEKGITKAAVETVAENTSDGVIAPMLCLALGGPILGMTYKAINTMDSMIAYHNDRYENFGKVAATLDDIANFIPSRLSAYLMIIAAFWGRDFDSYEAYRIFKRDRFNHKSPNSAQTESACAGALKLQLAGDAYYFGKLVKKPFIGDDIRPIEAEDICRVNKLMYMTTFILFIVSELFMLLANCI